MSLVIEDGTGSGLKVKVDKDHRLETISTTLPDEHHVNQEREGSWAVPFDAIDPTGADDYFVYLQNTDAAAGMTKELAQEGEITERDKVIFAAYQTSGSAIITNYFSSGVAVFAFLGTSVIVPLAVILVFKFVGANILRVWLNFEERRNPTQGAQA